MAWKTRRYTVFRVWHKKWSTQPCIHPRAHLRTSNQRSQMSGNGRISGWWHIATVSFLGSMSRESALLYSSSACRHANCVDVPRLTSPELSMRARRMAAHSVEVSTNHFHWLFRHRNWKRTSNNSILCRLLAVIERKGATRRGHIFRMNIEFGKGEQYRCCGMGLAGEPSGVADKTSIPITQFLQQLHKEKVSENSLKQHLIAAIQIPNLVLSVKFAAGSCLPQSSLHQVRSSSMKCSTGVVQYCGHEGSAPSINVRRHGHSVSDTTWCNVTATWLINETSWTRGQRY
jgi:hypothetical protein